jgi:carbonic anhydrase
MRRHQDPFGSFFIFCLVLVVAAISYVVGNIRQRKRTEALQRVASDLGLAFFPQDNDQLYTELGWCDLFSRGRSQKLLNLMRGSSDGRYIAVFDNQHVTGSGRSKKTWRTTVALLRSDGPAMPRFLLRPEGTWDKISNWFGSADIDFNIRPQFSRSYVLRGDDEQAIRALFTEPLLEYFEQHPGLSTEGTGNTLLVYRLGRCVPPDGVSQFLTNAFELQSLFHAASQGT